MPKPHPYADTPQYQQAQPARQQVWIIDSTTPAEARVIERTTFVYFIQAGEGGPIKIGTTNDVTRRLQSMQVGNPETLVLLRQIRGGGATEARLHGRFEDACLRGEWYKPTPELLAYIENPDDVLAAWSTHGDSWADATENDPEMHRIRAAYAAGDSVRPN